MPNIVYVLTNEAMPGLVKIGRTANSLEERIKQLNTSGVPLPFECHFAAEVNDSAKLEATLHRLFADHRINVNREFFKVDPEKVVLAISIGEFKEVTPGVVELDKDEQLALEKAKARRPRIRLEALGINPGAELTFSRDSRMTAVVEQGGSVNFQGESLSLSAAALKALHQLGYRTSAASGSAYWVFDGELLDERRIRMEADQFDEKSMEA